jgi:hypothetical protein
VERIPLRIIPEAVPREWFSWGQFLLAHLVKKKDARARFFGWLIIRADPAENCFQGFGQGSGFLGVCSANTPSRK